MNETVYRVVQRIKGSNDPWVQHNSSGSRTGRPYSSVGVAKAEATRRSNESYNWQYEYRVESAVLNWEAV